MATLKVYALGGLDKKSNHLIRKDDKATDMLNMEYDTQSTLKKRNGFGETNSVSAVDSCFFPTAKEKLFFNNNSEDISIVGNGYTKTLKLPKTNETDYFKFASDTSISSAENMLSLYFTSTDYSVPVMKYDGSHIYRAGLPTPRKTSDVAPTISASSGGTSRLFYSYKDANGLEVFSPYYEIQSTPTNSSVISVNSLAEDSTCSENGFFNRYCWTTFNTVYIIDVKSSNTASPAFPSDITRRLEVSSHNYQAGEYFIFETDNPMTSLYSNITGLEPGRSFVKLKIQSVGANYIIFEQDLNSTINIEIAPMSAIATAWPSNGTLTTEYPLDIRCKFHVYWDTGSSGVFTRYGTFVLDNRTKINTKTIIQLYRTTIPIVDFSTVYMEDVYNTSTSKIMPPYCKYLSSFGDQMVFGSVQSYIGFNNKRISYNNNDLFIYSDILTGDCCENTSEFNRQKVGETYDGDITGVVRCNDSVVVFKDNSTFTVDGILSPGQYSIRKINTNGVGCKSHKSIVITDEGVLFQAHNGIYYTNGMNVTRVTQELDYLFETGDFSLTRGSRYKRKQKVIFYVPEKNKTVVIDYYYKQVYLWDSITASKGIYEDNDGDVYFYNGAKLFKFNTSYSDNGDPINAYYATNWHHMGEPSLNKKFIQMRVFSLTSDVFSLGIAFQVNWTETNKSSITEQIASGEQTVLRVFNMITAQSMRVIFSNNTLNENLAITGYEITYEPYNVRDKN